MDTSLTNIRHERSKKDFPGLTLREGEYVEFAFKRSKAYLFMIIGATLVSFAIIALAFVLTLMVAPLDDEMGRNFIFIILAALFFATGIISFIAVIIYSGNQLFITNKRVIQRVMESPMVHSVNIIDLVSVEDVSFHQNGILPMIFHYGTLRLATVGDETSYTFKYSDISKQDLEAVTKIVSAAKKEQHEHTHED